MGTEENEYTFGKLGGKNNDKKLYPVLSHLGVFTFCTCKILIFFVCIVASFKLSCV